MKKFLFNPFVRIAGFEALTIGLLMAVAISLNVFISPAHFDGAIDLHFASALPFNWQKQLLLSLSENLVNILSVGIVLSIAAFMLVGSRFRIVDVLGTTAYARFPLYLASFLNIGGTFAVISEKLIPQPGQTGLPNLIFSDWLILSAGFLVLLPCMIWMFYLLYQAYTVSTGLKSTRAVVSFIIGLLIAEVLSKTALSYVFNLVSHMELI